MDFGKSLLIVAGVGYGVVKAFDVLAPEPEENGPSRLELIEERLVRMEKRLEVQITRSELNEAMDQLSRRLEDETERRFEVQDRSVQSLRTMMARTDELLEQVIENIEAMRIPA